MAQYSIKKNTLFSAIKTLSSIIFPLITFPYISRVLLPENVGKINFGLSIISYFSLITSLGITTYAIRECSALREDKEKLSNTASQIFSINVITTIVAYTLGMLESLINHNLTRHKMFQKVLMEMKKDYQSIYEMQDYVQMVMNPASTYNPSLKLLIKDCLSQTPVKVLIQEDIVGLDGRSADVANLSMAMQKRKYDGTEESYGKYTGQ